MAIILTVIHFKYIVLAACAFTPIDANGAAFESNSVFRPKNSTAILLMIFLVIKKTLYTLNGKQDRLISITEFPTPYRF